MERKYYENGPYVIGFSNDNIELCHDDQLSLVATPPATHSTGSAAAAATAADSGSLAGTRDRKGPDFGKVAFSDDASQCHAWQESRLKSTMGI